MKADPSHQQRLLDLQAVDTSLDRLAARRRSLPELAAVEELAKALSAVDDDVVRVRTELSDLGRAQRKLNNEIDIVRSRVTRDRNRLDSGLVASPRELENLQAELASLARRQGVLEDEVLEGMEAGEELEGRLARLAAERERIAGERDAAAARRDEAIADIDAEVARLRGEREALVPVLPAALVALYERIRASSGGVGAAALVRRRCEGCHLELSGADLRAMKVAPPDDVVRCEECRRILVRSTESGL
jgi:predicted  nucleic acid-binding Zn-ribbon protein